MGVICHKFYNSCIDKKGIKTKNTYVNAILVGVQCHWSEGDDAIGVLGFGFSSLLAFIILIGNFYQIL